MVLSGLLGLYGLKYDNATAYGLSLYLCSYKLVGSAIAVSEQGSTLIDTCVFKTEVFVFEN